MSTKKFGLRDTNVTQPVVDPLNDLATSGIMGKVNEGPLSSKGERFLNKIGAVFWYLEANTILTDLVKMTLLPLLRTPMALWLLWCSPSKCS